MLAAVSAPAMESIPAWQVAAAGAAAVAVGAVLLLWGRILHRVALMGLGVAGGCLLAGPLAPRLGLSPGVTRAAAILTGAVIGLALARLVWAVLGAALVVAVAVLAVLPAYLPSATLPYPSLQVSGELPQWLTQFGAYLWRVLRYQWEYHRPYLAGVGGSAGGVVLLLFLLRGRLAAICMSALLGAALTVAGVLATLGRLSGGLWAGLWSRWYVAVGLLALAVAAALVFQYPREIAAGRAAAEREAKPAEKGQTKPADRADKKK